VANNSDSLDPACSTQIFRFTNELIVVIGERNTYKRGRKGERIVAKRLLIEDFKRVHKNHDESAARQRFEKLRIVLGYQNKRPKGRNRASNVSRVNQADIHVSLARKGVPLLNSKLAPT
jgi:hypothetical protein